MKQGTQALEALLTLIGQNTWNLDALTALLMSKGIITDDELGNFLSAQYLDKHPGISPAEWARRCMDQEDLDALNAFFEET
jgi:hypothetical protein